MLVNILLILLMYVAHIFLCRHINLWIIETEIKHNFSKNSEVVPLFWFFPLFGLMATMIFAFMIWIRVWKETPTGKWFLGNNIK